MALDIGMTERVAWYCTICAYTFVLGRMAWGRLLGRYPFVSLLLASQITVSVGLAAAVAMIPGWRVGPTYAYAYFGTRAVVALLQVCVACDLYLRAVQKIANFKDGRWVLLSGGVLLAALIALSPLPFETITKENYVAVGFAALRFLSSITAVSLALIGCVILGYLDRVLGVIRFSRNMRTIWIAFGTYLTAQTIQYLALNMSEVYRREISTAAMPLITVLLVIWGSRMSESGEAEPPQMPVTEAETLRLSEEFWKNAKDWFRKDNKHQAIASAPTS